MTEIATRIERSSRRVVVCSGSFLSAVIILALIPWQSATASPEGSPPLRPAIEGKVAEILGGEDEIGIETNDTVLPPGMKLALMPIKLPSRFETDSYEIDISDNGNRVVAVDKRTKNRTAIGVLRKTRITSATLSDNVAACIMRGTGISLLILYNNQLGKWSTFSLPQCERPLRAEIKVGNNVVGYRLNDRIIAYSVKKDMWSTLAVKADPAVGDDFVVVTTATTKSVFAAESGIWVTTTISSAAMR